MAITIQQHYTDPRVKRTRHLLQQALFELMKEKGFASISIRDITERATVNRATFYAHFSDKFSLLDTVMREEIRAHLAKNVEPEAQWTMDTLRAFIRAVMEFFAGIHSHYCNSAQIIHPMMERAAQEEIYSYLLHLLNSAARTEQRRTVPVETIALVMSWAIFGSAVRIDFEAQPGVDERMIEQMLSVLTEGLMQITPGLSAT